MGPPMWNIFKYEEEVPRKIKRIVLYYLGYTKIIYPAPSRVADPLEHSKPTETK